MGKALLAATIENREDRFRAEQGQPAADRLRRVEVSDALVDTGAMGLLLPARFVGQWGLRPLRTRWACWLGGPLCAPTYRAVPLVIQGRDCAISAGAVGDDFPGITGQVPLEMLDRGVDPKNRRLLGDPEHGGEDVMEIFGQG